MIYWLVLLFAVAANVVANIAFKHLMTRTNIELSRSGLGRILLEPYLWVAAVSAVILLGGYLFALRNLPLSIAYPAATSLSILGVVLAGVIIYGEVLYAKGVLGIFLITLGLFFLVRT